MSMEADRRASLLAAKVRALAGTGWEVGAGAVTGTFPDGATLIDPAARRGWVMVESDAERRLGGALAVARRAELEELHLLVESEPAGGVLARRAGELRLPVSVWRPVGRTLEPVAAVAAEPEPVLAPSAELYRPVLLAAGLEPVVEGGDLIGELHGLEVARVTVDDDGHARLEAGVGRFDREAGAMMFADLGETDSVVRAVDIVSRYRRPEVDRHPLNVLVPERWLRSLAVADPTSIGAAELTPVTSTSPRRNLTEDGVATAVGTDLGGRSVVAVFSTGVQLDLVPTAADDRLHHDPSARLMLVLPARDAVPLTADLAALLVEPAELVTVPDDWRHGGAGA